MSNGRPAGRQTESIRLVVWSCFAVAALLLLAIDDLVLWSTIVLVGALVVASFPGLRPTPTRRPDRGDLIVIGALYLTVVSSFRLAFVVFTTDNVLGLFLCFAVGLVLGVAGPVAYQVWRRGRGLRSLGIGLHRLGPTIALGLALAAIQFAMTLWGYDLPEAVDWVPLLVMSVVVGLFEAVFFRGFIQNRLEESFGTVAAVTGAAALYALYHIGYGMGVEEMWFLFGLGVVYAIAFRTTSNILVLWPLLTPLGAFFNNVDAGDIELPWASIAGFVDVGAVMVAVIWLARRSTRRRGSEPIHEGALVS